MIETRSLSKSFGHRPVLRGVDFRATEGEFVALLGPNGSGKTTFLRILATLARPNFGSVTVAGHALPAEADGARRAMGVVTHQPLLYGDLTGEENLHFYARVYGVGNAAARVKELLERVGLARRARERVRAYSRGMQQRLAIARALVHDPTVLLLDEPHTGLDPDAAATLDGLLRDVAARGRTVLMTTHDLERARALAGRVDVLARGTIAARLSTTGLTTAELARAYESAVGGA